MRAQVIIPEKGRSFLKLINYDSRLQTYEGGKQTEKTSARAGSDQPEGVGLKDRELLGFVIYLYYSLILFNYACIIWVNINI